jgi:twinkle protein
VGTVVSKGPCPRCTSSDACATYEDGSDYCFSCLTPGGGDGKEGSRQAAEKPAFNPIKGHYADLTARGINEATAKKCEYQLGELSDGTKVHIQLIKDSNGRLIDQKTRDKAKNFRWLGGSKYKGIIGSWGWPSKGKSVVITEGEIDRMSVSQAFDNKYPTGSLPNGSGSVKNAILEDYEKLCAFDSIYLCFDNDEPGQKALKEACELLPVGKVKIMTTPEKDANATLMKSGPAPLVRAYWDAKDFRPDGIREGREFTRERLKSKRAKGYAMPWPKLDAMWLGSRDGELTTICAGSGIGKTTIVRDLAYAMRMDHDMKIGNIYLEEDNDTSAKAYCALHAGVPLKQVLNDPDSVSDEAWDAALAAVIHDGMLFYDHFGSLESERLMTMMRYMAASGCKRIVLDHISIVTSGLESGSEGERKDIDILMTKLASFVKETGCSVYAIVHLKRTKKDFNGGDQINLSDMRGSAAIEQLSFNVLAVERDQQDEDNKLFAQLRSLKCRITGETGEADRLKWNVEKGRYEIASAFNSGGDDTFDPHQKQEDTVF